MPDYIPKFAPGATVTFTAGTDITGGRLVSVTGPRRVGHPGSDNPSVVGVAAFDAPPGDDVTVYTRGAGVHTLVANGPIPVGTNVISSTGGTVVPLGSGSNRLGITLTASAAAGDPIDILFT